MKTSIVGVTPISIDVCHFDRQLPVFTHFFLSFNFVRLTKTLPHRADLLRL